MSSPIFDIVPFVGAAELRFGMSPEEVASRMGPPDSISTTFLGERNEERKDVAIRYDVSTNALVEFGFVPPCEIRLDGNPVFEVPDPVALLSVYDPEPYEALGMLFFLKIGITLGGYHDGDESQRSLCLCARNRLETAVAAFGDELRPYRRIGHVS